MVNPKFRAYLLLAGFFALGAVGGAAFGRAFTQHEFASSLFAGDTEVRETMFLKALSAELSLNEQQLAQVSGVAQRYRSARRDLFQQVFQSCGKPLEELQAKIEDEMCAALEPPQQERFKQMMAQRRKHLGINPR